MTGLTTTIDAEGRLLLSPALAGTTVRVEQLNETEWSVRTARGGDAFDPDGSLRPLSDRDRDLFLAALDAPARPVPALVEAARKYGRG